MTKSVSLKVEQLQHQLAGHNRHRFRSKSESLDQLRRGDYRRQADVSPALADLDIGGVKSDIGPAAGLRAQSPRHPLLMHSVFA